MMRRALMIALTALLLGACASLPNQDPLQVTVAGIESLPGEGMELRMLVKLRDGLRGFRIAWQPPQLRHFTVRFEPLG